MKGTSPERKQKAFTPDRTLRVVERIADTLEELSDEALMLSHGEGDERAFEELVRRHQKGVLNYVFRMVHSMQVAEELTQEVFIALVKAAGRYEPRAKFTTYLYAIAGNIVIKEWARRKRRPKLFSLSWFEKSADDGFDPSEHVGDDRVNAASLFERSEVSEAVKTALVSLPAHQREAFVLRRFQELSYEEIAAATNAPVGTVKSRVVRAEQALRPLLARFREYVTG